MNSEIRAVICDVYGTLLEVGPPPVDARQRWESGCRELGLTPVPLVEFNTRTAAMIDADNARRRLEGEPFPDVNWLELVRRIFITDGPELCAPDVCRLHARCARTCTAMPGAVAVLEAVHARGVRLGIASNAQDCTRSELCSAGIPLDLFDPALCFLSGEQGFAKPSPRVFSLLSERLAAHGITPRQTLMIGDSPEKDVAPAAAAGWQTWHLGPRTWMDLGREKGFLSPDSPPTGSAP